MYFDYKGCILSNIIITFSLFSLFSCLLIYIHIPYGNIELREDFCNITSTESIEYEFDEFMTVAHINIPNEKIPGRTCIVEEIGRNSLSTFAGKYVFEKNDVLSGVPAWFCNAECNKKNFDKNCFDQKYQCNATYCKCYVGKEITNGFYPVILQEKCSDEGECPPHAGRMGIEVFCPTIIIGVIFYLILGGINASCHHDDTKHVFTKFEPKILFTIRSFLHLIAPLLVAIFVLGRRLSVTVFTGSLKIETLSILYFIGFPYGTYEVFRNFFLLVGNHFNTESCKLENNIFSGTNNKSKLEFNVRIFTSIFTVYIPIIWLMSILWYKYGIENDGEKAAFVLLNLQVLIQIYCCLYQYCKNLNPRELPNKQEVVNEVEFYTHR